MPTRSVFREKVMLEKQETVEIVALQHFPFRTAFLLSPVEAGGLETKPAPLLGVNWLCPLLREGTALLEGLLGPPLLREAQEDEEQCLGAVCCPLRRYGVWGRQSTSKAGSLCECQSVGVVRKKMGAF